MIHKIKYYLHFLIGHSVTLISRNTIVGKYFDNTPFIIYYEKAQHLTFLFKSRINYESNLQAQLIPLIKQGHLVFDIGANIGQYSLKLSQVVGGNGKVIAFEPDKRTFSFLQFNVHINRINNVECINSGIGSSSDVHSFYRDTTTGGRRGSFKKEFVGSNFEGQEDVVEVVALDDLINKYGLPDFIKIDVEGYEIEVLKGLSHSLENTNFFIETRTSTRSFVFNYFYEQGFRCFCLDKEPFEVHEVSDIPDFANLLFSSSYSLTV